MKAKRVWRILNPRFKNIYIYIYRLSTVEAPTIPCCHCFIPTHCAFQGHCQSFSLGCPKLISMKHGLTAWDIGVIRVEIGRVPQQSAEYTNHLRSQNSGHPKGGEPQKSRKEGKEGTISRLGNWWNCALFRKSFSFRCLSIKSLESHGLIAVLLSSEKCSIFSRKRFTWPSFVKEAAARNLTWKNGAINVWWLASCQHPYWPYNII